MNLSTEYGKSVKTLKDQIYRSLLSDIITGIYPSAELLTEKYLVNKYQVSRAPVREALTQLTTNGILVSVPRRGYKLIQPSESKLLEIVQFRSILECGFFHSYSYYIKQTDIQALRALCTQYESFSVDETLARWQCNCDFHLKLFSLYGNHHAYSILRSQMNLQLLSYSLKQQTHTYSARVHSAFLDYIEKKDTNTAVELLRSDIESILFPGAGMQK